MILFLLLAGTAAYGQKITDSNYSTIAYIKSDGTVQNSNYSTIGHIKGDGTVQNASYQTIGHVKDGRVQDANYRTVAHYDGVKAKWVAFLVFFW